MKVAPVENAESEDGIAVHRFDLAPQRYAKEGGASSLVHVIGYVAFGSEHTL